MIPKIKHILKDIDRSHDIPPIIHTRPSQCLHQPERTHAERTLSTSHSVIRSLRIVAVDKASRSKAAAFRGEQDAVHRAEEAGVIGRDEKDEGSDEDRGVEDIARFVGLLEAMHLRGVAVSHDLFVDFVADLEPFCAVGTRETAFVGKAETAVEGYPHHDFAIDKVLLFVADFPDRHIRV